MEDSSWIPITSSLLAAINHIFELGYASVSGYSQVNFSKANFSGWGADGLYGRMQFT